MRPNRTCIGHLLEEIVLRSYLRIGGFVIMGFALAISAACSVPVAGTTATPAVGENEPAESSTSTGSSLSTSGEMTPSSAAPAVADQAAFGETYKWVDGLE